ncbi:MAG: hypothetical protein Q8R15_01325 [Candidatus Micrarchaeota archaeon]|nr:hypothetical protein [Candidatus Micrarchaeota archaeon]
MAEPKLLFENEAEFRKQVKASNGRVVVVVHPFCVEPNRLPHTYVRTRKSILQKTKWPVVIMEEKWKLNQTHSALENDEKHYYVETSFGPTPAYGWKKLHKALKNAGVNTILLGGMFGGIVNRRDAAAYHPDVQRYEKRLNRRTTESIVGACVGLTYEEMIKAKHGKVRFIPAFVNPPITFETRQPVSPSKWPRLQKLWKRLARH